MRIGYRRLQLVMLLAMKLDRGDRRKRRGATADPPDGIRRPLHWTFLSKEFPRDSDGDGFGEWNPCSGLGAHGGGVNSNSLLETTS